MTRRKSLALIALFAGIALAVMTLKTEAAGNNPFIGTFVMNAAKSTADPGPLPQSAKVTTEDAGNGMMKTNAEMVMPDGTTTKTEATYAYDGKAYPMTGNPNVDTVAVTQPDPNTLEITEKKADEVVANLIVKATADGKAFSTTVTGTDPEGKPFKNTGVYERQD